MHQQKSRDDVLQTATEALDQTRFTPVEVKEGGPATVLFGRPDQTLTESILPTKEEMVSGRSQTEKTPVSH